jgi:uncharacterized protein YraI
MTQNPKIRSAVSALTSAASLCATLAIGGAGQALAAGPAAPLAQADCTPSAITTTNVNMRTGPGTNFPIIRTLPATAFLTVTGTNADSSWFQVVFNGEQGWVIARYLITSCVAGVPVIVTPGLPATPAPVPVPPATGNVTFTASASTINFGQCTVLRWNVPSANQVLLSTGALQSPVQLAGTQQVCPSLSTRFYLQVDTAGNRQFFPLDITVVNPYNPANFRSNAYVVTPGQCTQLQWIAGNTRSVNLLDSSTGSNTTVGNTGDIQVCPSRTAVYTIRAVLATGAIEEQSQTVTVAAAPATPIPLP